MAAVNPTIYLRSGSIGEVESNFVTNDTFIIDPINSKDSSVPIDFTSVADRARGPERASEQLVPSNPNPNHLLTVHREVSSRPGQTATTS